MESTLERGFQMARFSDQDWTDPNTLAVGFEGFSTVSDLALTDEQITKFNAGAFAIYVFAGSIYADDATPIRQGQRGIVMRLRDSHIRLSARLRFA